MKALHDIEIRIADLEGSVEKLKAIVEEVEEPAEIHCSNDCDSFTVSQDEYNTMLERIANENSYMREHEAIDEYIF